MGKTSAANVIDLDSFRQRKLSAKSESPMMAPFPGTPALAHVGYPAVMMPVWFWVPVWAPVVP